MPDLFPAFTFPKLQEEEEGGRMITPPDSSSGISKDVINKEKEKASKMFAFTAQKYARKLSLGPDDLRSQIEKKNLKQGIFESKIPKFQNIERVDPLKNLKQETSQEKINKQNLQRGPEKLNIVTPKFSFVVSNKNAAYEHIFRDLGSTSDSPQSPMD